MTLTLAIGNRLAQVLSDQATSGRLEKDAIALIVHLCNVLILPGSLTVALPEKDVMTDLRQPIYIRENLHVVAITEDLEHGSDKIVGYAVMTSTGAKLRYELSLDSAKAWLDQFIDQDVVTHTPPVIDPISIPVLARPSKNKSKARIRR